ncbi:MAG: GNAT family N-acetyltransferase [Paludibacteraceae bacterium]|nr:GNAT family N-acetyltransferase [Paludibacteraceae bacterium]
MFIRRLQIEDLPIRIEWMNNPAIYSTMHYDLPITLEKTTQWFYNNVNNVHRADMVVLDEKKQIVAFCGVTAIDLVVKKGESYTFVNPNMKGQGIGTKARTLLLNYVFNELGLNKVYCYTNEDNVASWKLSEKLGFKLEGVHRKEYFTANGEWKNRLYHGLLKEEWLNKNEQ